MKLRKNLGEMRQISKEKYQIRRIFRNSVSGTEMHTKILALPYNGVTRRKKKTVSVKT